MELHVLSSYFNVVKNAFPVTQKEVQNVPASISQVIASKFPSITEAYQRIGLRCNFSPFSAIYLGVAALTCYSLYKVINFIKIKLKLLETIKFTKFCHIEHFDTPDLRDKIIRQQQGKEKGDLENAIISVLKSALPDEKFKIVKTEFTQVTNPSEICVQEYALTCRSGEVKHDLRCTVGMRKGSGKFPRKAIGEDACVADHVNICFQGTNYEIPFIAMFDGGGGHTLAQYGREKFKAQFEKRLTEMVSISNRFDATVIAAAMQQADDDLLARFDDEDNPTFSGSGYAQLKANHAHIKRKYGVPAEKFRQIVADKLNMNPREYYQGLKGDLYGKEVLLKIGQKECHLSTIDDYKELQSDYELSMGTRESITVQVVASAFLITDGKIECITYNRGDCMALHANQNSVTRALSERVSDRKRNRSCIELQSGDQVVLACDGVTEAISINEFERVNEMLDENNVLGNYTQLLMLGVADYSGDDQSLIHVRV